MQRLVRRLVFVSFVEDLALAISDLSFLRDGSIGISDPACTRSPVVLQNYELCYG